MKHIGALLLLKKQLKQETNCDTVCCDGALYLLFSLALHFLFYGFYNLMHIISRVTELMHNKCIVHLIKSLHTRRNKTKTAATAAATFVQHVNTLYGLVCLFFVLQYFSFETHF